MGRKEDALELKKSMRDRLLGGVERLPSNLLTIAAASSQAPTGIHALGVGRKRVLGDTVDEIVLRVYVVQKLPTSLLSPDVVVPSEIDGIPTDVIESPPAYISNCTLNRRKRQRPILGGISAAHEAVTAGTLSCFCKSILESDSKDAVFALSNNHVFANVNDASIGDRILQQSPADGGTIAEHFADLHRFVPIELSALANNRVDAAIARVKLDVGFDKEICSIGQIQGVMAAQEGMTVIKHGRTTGLTEGTIDLEEYDALVGMDHSNPNIVGRFVDQLRIEGIGPMGVVGKGGDSGSLVLDKATKAAVGLYFAGPESGTYGVANPIHRVLEELEIELL